MEFREINTPISPAYREEARRAWLAEAPHHYSPWLHLLLPASVGVGIITLALGAIEAVRLWELLTVPLTFVLANAAEWRIHRDLLHKRDRLVPWLYEQHTPRHHVVFVTDDMALRSRAEYRFVLIPMVGLLLLLVGTFAPAAALSTLVGTNVAALFLATAVAYVLAYEWLHLAYHARRPSRVIARLARHHATHHDPRLMRKWNLNVTIPLWDWVRRTIK